VREILTMRRIAVIIASIAVFLGGSAAAQEARSEIGVQGTGFFTTDTTRQGTTQRSTNTGGFLVGYRYSFNRWLAAEGVYGYDRNTQEYFAPAGFARVQANIHQATGALSFVYRHRHGSDSALISSQKEVRSSSILRAMPSPASQPRNVRPPVHLPTAVVPIFHFSGMSPCVPNIVVWCTAHRTLGWQRSIPMQSLIQRNHQRESYSGFDSNLGLAL
jgi:hypothetical protein